MTYNQLLKKLRANTLDKETCIDYFNKISKTRSHISFSSKMIISLFKHKHDYIFKYLFDNGIIYSCYFDNDTINKISRNARKSVSLVYAINYPSILIREDNFVEKESFIYNKYTPEQKITLEYIYDLYHNLRFCDGKTQHPYNIYFAFNFHYLLKNEKTHFNFLKNKLIESKDNIERIKLYFFEFYYLFNKIPQTHVDFILNFFHKNNCLSSDNFIPQFLLNKHYLNYFLNNKFSINEFTTDFNSIIQKISAEDAIKVSKHIIHCLDTNFKYSIRNSVSLIYFFVLQSIFEKNGLFNFYINVLIDLVTQHDTNFECLCREFDYCTEYNPVNLDILLELNKDNQFKNLFDNKKKNLKIENKLISDYLHVQLNYEHF